MIGTVDTGSKPQWMTVTQAAAHLGTSTRSVHRWIADTTHEQVPRDRIRLPDQHNRYRRKLVVEVGALSEYADTL
jgi:hypothetical protein